MDTFMIPAVGKVAKAMQASSASLRRRSRPTARQRRTGQRQRRQAHRGRHCLWRSSRRWARRTWGQ
eukprot:8551785-Lingulodinium_polyedra.AAC.1